LIALILAYFFLALAVVGVFLPGIPTIPFLLLSAWFSAKGSGHLYRWLYEHPRLGRILIDWERRGAISRTSKVLAVSMLLVSWVVIYHRLDSLWVLVFIGMLFFAIASFLVTRPEPT